MATDLSIDSIWQTIAGRIKERWPSSSIAWPGVTFTPPKAAWLRPNLLWGDGSQLTIDGYNEVVAILRTQFFDVPGSGFDAMHRLADDFRALFDGLTISGVEFGAASGLKPATEPTEQWIQGVVDIPVRVFETVTA